MSEETIPESRTYRHTTCGAETTIGDQSFEVASNPMSDMTQSYCTQCGGMVPITELEWTDTNETISDYYARHSANATDTQRLLCSKKSMLVLIAGCAVLGIIGMLSLADDDSMSSKLILGGGGLFIGCLVGAGTFSNLIEGPITRKVTGVKDTRTLK